MNPTNDQSNGRVGVPLTDQRQSPTPARVNTTSQDAAADVVRQQINAIYSRELRETPPRTNPAPTTPTLNTAPRPRPQQQTTAYNHAMRTSPVATSTPTTQPATAAAVAPTQTTPQNQPQKAHTQVAEDQWKRYHSEWQKYYQMYYERYYANHLTVKDQEISRLTEEAGKIGTQKPSTEPNNLQQTALKELRAEIQEKVRASANKVKKSRHFMPALAGVAVLLVFMFLQYNRVIFGAVAAYTTPGSIDPQNIIVDTASNISVSPDPRMIIPKINVDAPVVYGVPSDSASQLAAMRNGIAHFSIPGANAVPGQAGNAVFAAHSSNDAFAAGDYKFVFAQNEKLTKGDVIYMNYEGKRYTYSVTSTEVVLPHEVSKVQIATDKPMLTLVSCVPLGTAQKRLLVFAEQISPDPAQASAASASTSTSNANAAIPGKPEPTLIERLFGAS